MGKIIDVSYWQGDIDWAKVRKEVDFVIFRASIGEKIDSKFLTYTRNCGLPFGVYHYVKASNKNEAIKEAKWFVNCANQSDIRPTIYYADIEYETQTRDNIDEVAYYFLKTLKELGCSKRGIYISQTNYNYLKERTHQLCQTYWIPRYGKDTGELPSSKYYPTAPCDLWQYTSKGKVEGIKENVDLNIFHGDKTLDWFTRKNEILEQSISTPAIVGQQIKVTLEDVYYLLNKIWDKLNEK